MVDTTAHTSHGARGPVRRQERALAPDLTRGAMLLLIAVANCLGVVLGSAPGVDPAPQGVDRGINLFMFSFVHARAYPVFAIMFGYGLVQLARRQDAAGASVGVARSVLLRRNAWLVVFGVLHGVLLYSGDFLGAYGLVGIIAVVLLLRRGERVYRLAVWVWVLYLGYVLVLAVLAFLALARSSGPAAGVPANRDAGSFDAPDYGTSVLRRLSEWPLHTATVLGFITIVWLGMWAARRRVLEDPASHRRLLRWVAAGGLAVAVAGGLPMGLVSAGMLPVDAATADAMYQLYTVSGTFAGPGYIALLGLVALRVSERGKTANRMVVAVSALGQRSLSGYLFQSVAWLLLLSSFTLALRDVFGSPTVTGVLIAVLVWLATVLGAYLLHRRSGRGPAEVLLRRLTYGVTR